MGEYLIMGNKSTVAEYSLGIDIGSTTAKIVLRKGEEVLFERYERHFSQVREKRFFTSPVAETSALIASAFPPDFLISSAR